MHNSIVLTGEHTRAALTRLKSWGRYRSHQGNQCPDSGRGLVCDFVSVLRGPAALTAHSACHVPQHRLCRVLSCSVVFCHVPLRQHSTLY